MSVFYFSLFVFMLHMILNFYIRIIFCNFNCIIKSKKGAVQLQFLLSDWERERNKGLVFNSSHVNFSELLHPSSLTLVYIYVNINIIYMHYICIYYTYYMYALYMYVCMYYICMYVYNTYKETERKWSRWKRRVRSYSQNSLSVDPGFTTY